MAHTYYTMTEYEQMLVAAGWVDAGSLDDEYLEYCRNFAYPELEDAFLDYDQWTATKKELDALMLEYDGKFENMPQDEYFRNIKEVNALLAKMNACEIALGY